jgi:hypothetical protein
LSEQIVPSKRFSFQRISTVFLSTSTIFFKKNGTLINKVTKPRAPPLSAIPGLHSKAVREQRKPAKHFLENQTLLSFVIQQYLVRAGKKKKKQAKQKKLAKST